MSVSKLSENDELGLDREVLGQRLREAREYLHLSQEEVAKKVGIARAAISLIESGQRKVDAIELSKLAREYKRPTSYFTDEAPGGGGLPSDVEFAARAIQGLTKKDLDEVARFADFLRSRKETQEGAS
jgi:transcriptional regulator with XRE-family HTH domain